MASVYTATPAKGRVVIPSSPTDVVKSVEEQTGLGRRTAEGAKSEERRIGIHTVYLDRAILNDKLCTTCA